MALDETQVRSFAARLREASQTRAPIVPLTDEAPGMTPDDGYRVQRAGVEARVRDGDQVTGWKVGLTSPAPRAQVGLDEAVFGHIFASTVYPSGASIDTARLIAPGAEAEIAFLLGADLEGPGITLHRALRAIESTLPAIEIVDCRFRDWKFRAPDLPADNSGGAALVVGTRPTSLTELDLALEGLVWEQNGHVMATATGAEVDGTPLHSVVWLANKLAEWGMSLRAGDVISAGSLSKILRPRAGESVRAHFTRLGSVSARFV